MARIVRSHYRYKRPPKKRKAVALEVPTVLTISDKTRRRVLARNDTPDQDTRRSRACVGLAAIVHRRLLCRVSYTRERGRSCRAGEGSHELSATA